MLEGYVAVCRTDGCANAGTGIPMVYELEDGPPDVIVCGVCGQVITETRDGRND